MSFYRNRGLFLKNIFNERSGSYFSDYYYDYDPLQVDQLVQKVIPQQIIPERTIVVFAE